jgi:hypothetical protein
VHWTTHKLSCCRESIGVASCEKVSEQRSLKEQMTSQQEKRICRCMFCGAELLVSSEDEAVKHLEDCPALQEQLNSKAQFTVPSMVKQQMKQDSDSSNTKT